MKAQKLRCGIGLLSLVLFSSVASAAQLCIAPIDDRYRQYGQYDDYVVQVAKQHYSVSHTKPVKVTNLKANQTVHLIIKKHGQSIESFPIKLSEKERLCLVKNDLYPTWMLIEMRKSCQC